VIGLSAHCCEPNRALKGGTHLQVHQTPVWHQAMKGGISAPGAVSYTSMASGSHERRNLISGCASNTLASSREGRNPLPRREKATHRERHALRALGLKSATHREATQRERWAWRAQRWQRERWAWRVPRSERWAWRVPPNQSAMQQERHAARAVGSESATNRERQTARALHGESATNRERHAARAVGVESSTPIRAPCSESATYREHHAARASRFESATH